MGPIYGTAFVWPEGGTVTIHPAQTAAHAATPGAFAKILTLQA